MMCTRLDRAARTVTGALLLGGLAMAAGCNQSGPAFGPEHTNERAAATGNVYQSAPIFKRAGVDPGIHPQVVLGVQTNPYAGNVSAAAEGRQLFVAYNCSGCHGGRAGGGMGPSLRDSVWIYGNSDTDLLSTISEGRSAGMPAWGARIPQDQIWKLVTYIRSLGTPQEPDPPPPQAHPLQLAPPPPPGAAGGKAIGAATRARS